MPIDRGEQERFDRITHSVLDNYRRPFTAEKMRWLIKSAIITTGSGDGSNEREELDYEYLARAMNDCLEDVVQL